MSTSTNADRPLLAVAVFATFVAFLDGSVVNLAGMVSVIAIRNEQHDDRQVSPRARMQNQFA